MLHAKRWLFLTHRWLGVVVCAFFAIWFVSGVVMMYVGYPKLTVTERLQHLPPLDPGAGLIGPRQALDAAGIHGPLQEFRLAAASGGRPVYLAVPARDGSRATDGPRRPSPAIATVVIDATSGEVLKEVDRGRALASAAAFAGAGVSMSYQGVLNEDAFTHSRALDGHRPLHRVQLEDPLATLLYVSSRTGEVVRDAPRAERLWNYAGAWIHWLYPFRGNVFDPYWADIVNWLSIVGIAVTLTGTVVGVLRWRFTGTYRRGSHSPYQGFMMRWHHITGLLFAFVTLTWIFSGLMSMNPWRIFDNGAPALRTESMNGGPLRIDAGAATPATLLADLPLGVRELRWTMAQGRVLVLASGAAGRPAVLDAGSGRSHAIDPGELRASLARLLPVPIATVEVLQAYDTYYYARDAHTMTGGGEKPLPVWRVVFADTHGTWVHVDPHTGSVLGRIDSGRRWSRWLFAMLHSWDWLPLLERRPLWDLLMVVLSIGGTALSLTSVVIGWRRLGRKLRSMQPRARTAPAAPLAGGPAAR